MNESIDSLMIDYRLSNLCWTIQHIKVDWLIDQWLDFECKIRMMEFELEYRERSLRKQNASSWSKLEQR